MKNCAVFLDRDGVLNRSIVKDGKPYAPRTLQDFEILPHVEPLLHQLKNLGYLLVVVTNQPDVGNGWVDKTLVESMNEQLKNKLPIDLIKVCYHSQQAGCTCRKPKPGMLVEAAQELQINLKKSIMIGDRTGDIKAGQAVGCKTIFIDYHYEEAKPTDADYTVGSIDNIIELFHNITLKANR